ncbi:MAG: PPOX class F420-dependent oxidoreductase [Acidimicrobiales bacterium]|nr:PPOX class F420-dependent oxidoreductase [Acidimicrobiales bacterium]
MTSKEIQDYLSLRNNMAIATLGLDSIPHLVAMWYGFYLDGTLGFWTFAKSQKAINIKRSPVITCMVESGESYSELKGVEFVADVDYSESQEEIIEIGSSIYERYFGPLDENGIRSVEMMSKKRIAVRVHPRQYVSWDHSKLGGKY